MSDHSRLPNHPEDPLLDAAVEAARLLMVALKTMRGEPEPAFASKVEHTVQRIYAIEAARTHEG